MYSPKIKEELVLKLYRLAKEKGIPMTQLVNDIIKDYLEARDERIHGTKQAQGGAGKIQGGPGLRA